jgi:UDP-2,3-diacylglucosamine pyrophosphatase LpxH
VLLFVSDIHMADTAAGEPAADDDLAAFVGDALSRRTHDPVTLVLLGDIIDFLRSPRWDELWQRNAAPWSAMAPGFANFQGSPSEACVLDVAGAVATRYRSFSKTLAAGVRQGSLRVVYVPGNHDYMVQLSTKLRREVVRMLSLENTPTKPFPLAFDDAESSVYATHGNTFDVLNHHREDEGRWAFGDAVVLRLVNRFQAEACASLGCGIDSEIGRSLADIDNVEPLIDIPLFVRRIAEALSTSSDRTKVVVAWRRCVEELLAIEAFAEDQYDDLAFRGFRAVLKLSANARLAAVVAEHGKLLSLCAEDRYADAARNLALSQKRRFIVFGHTHEPTMTPLGKVRGKQAYYVNTGSWRRVVSRDPRAGGGFAASRAACRFIVEDASWPGPRYRLVREWQAS